MSRKLEEYHCDAMLYRGGGTLDREVSAVTCEVWTFDWEAWGMTEGWRLKFWSRVCEPLSKMDTGESELVATAVFPFETVLVVGEREA